MSTKYGRCDTASRKIKASSQAIYEAFIEPESLVMWLPPTGATGLIGVFEPREGGRFEMTLTFTGEELAGRGKSTSNTDIVRGRFFELVPGQRIVLSIDFVSDDPKFSGTMTMTWYLETTKDGAKVTIVAEDVPMGIEHEEHEAGMASSLANLATFVE